MRKGILKILKVVAALVNSPVISKLLPVQKGLLFLTLGFGLLFMGFDIQTVKSYRQQTGLWGEKEVFALNHFMIPTPPEPQIARYAFHKADEDLLITDKMGSAVAVAAFSHYPSQHWNWYFDKTYLSWLAFLISALSLMTSLLIHLTVEQVIKKQRINV